MVYVLIYPKKGNFFYKYSNLSQNGDSIYGTVHATLKTSFFSFFFKNSHNHLNTNQNYCIWKIKARKYCMMHVSYHSRSLSITFVSLSPDGADAVQSLVCIMCWLMKVCHFMYPCRAVIFPDSLEWLLDYFWIFLLPRHLKSCLWRVTIKGKGCILPIEDWTLFQS